MNPSAIPDQPFVLSLWHRKQAAMLYHFASLDYLKDLHRMVSQLVNGVVDPLLDLAKAQNRDSVLVDPRWGTRNTSENWSNNAWPFLKDFQASLVKDIAGRAFERYKITGANQCLRGIREYSMQWATPEEEQHFNDVLEAVGRYAQKIDDTLDDYHNSRWSDYDFAYDYKDFAAQFPKIPRFRIRADVQAESGKTLGRTGVYIAQDDPHAALQFGWTGSGGGKLRPSKTFNELGLDALKTVGRQDLWFSEQKMFTFATSKKYADLFRNDIDLDDKPCPKLASSAVARSAFITRPCKWYYVEQVNDEFEDIAEEEAKEAKAEHDVYQAQGQRRRTEGGNPCPEAGYYFTPACQGSRRHFKYGEIMPKIGNAMWQTIWQWDDQQ